MISYQDRCNDAIGCNGMSHGQQGLSQSFFKRGFVQKISPTERFTSFRDLFLKGGFQQLTTEQRRCQHHSFTSSKSLDLFTWSDPSVTQDRTAALEPSASAAAASHPSEPHPVVQRSLAKPRSVDSRIHDDHKRTNPVLQKRSRFHGEWVLQGWIGGFDVRGWV